jgi:CxxC motif-containing protein
LKSKIKEIKKLICIRCPRGCEIQTVFDGYEITEITGNFCKMGIDYVKDEISDPKRTVTTTVKIINGEMPLLPVWTESPIPKENVDKLLKQLLNIEIEAPVKKNDIVLKNIFDSGINVVASCSIKIKNI